MRTTFLSPICIRQSSAPMGARSSRRGPDRARFASMSEPHPQPQPQPQQQPQPAPLPVRATAPALLYVLAAFGVVLGGWGSLDSLTVGVSLLAPHDVYVEKLKTARLQPLE